MTAHYFHSVIFLDRIDINTWNDFVSMVGLTIFPGFYWRRHGYYNSPPLLTFIIYEGLNCLSLSARAVVKFSLVVATERKERLCGAAGGTEIIYKVK
jgi:hypothetical protein